MKILVNSIFILLLFCIYSCNNKEVVHISETVVFEGKLYQINSDKPFSGTVYDTYSDSSRQYEGVYSHGKPNGYLVYWYNNGNKKREGNLKNGSPIGRWKYYDKDGTLKNMVDN